MKVYPADDSRAPPVLLREDSFRGDDCGLPAPCRAHPFCFKHYNEAKQDASVTDVLAPVKGAPADSRAKHWCFTINNPTPYENSDVDSLVRRGVATYLVAGDEVASSGTRHIQGYVAFKCTKRLSQVRNLLSPRAHCEVMRGTSEQASNYCKKDGLFREFGDLPLTPAGRAKRDYDQIVASCKAGKLDELDSEVFFLHYNLAKRIKTDFAKAPENLDSVCGMWLQGPPGGGKSFMARGFCTPAELYLKPCNKWWDSYQDQEYVLLDDFDHNHKCLGHHLKIWSDRYAFAAEQKGSTIQIRPKSVMVTSNYSIAEIFGDDPALAKALLRRFDVFQVNDRVAVPVPPADA